MSKLAASTESRRVTRALQDAVDAVKDAASADIHDIKLIEHGRCPECHGRTETLLFTNICPICGWMRRVPPQSGRCVVHLVDGDTIECDRVYQIRGDRVLCVTDDVVHDELCRSAVRRLQYVWDPTVLEELKQRFRRRIRGTCAWCEKHIDDEAGEGNGACETYVAFGAFQEHHVFCSQSCLESFQRHYPSRVHRNCYETECDGCDMCIKQFSSFGFRKNTTT